MNFTQRCQEGFRVHDSLKTDLAFAYRSCECSNGFSPRLRQADDAKVCISKHLGRGEQMSKAVGSREWLPESLHDPPCKNGRTLYRDLLTENRAGCEFESVPAARHAQSRSACQQWTQQRVGSETANNRSPISIQVKNCANPLDDEEERARISKVQTHHERVRAFIK